MRLITICCLAIVLCAGASAQVSSKEVVKRTSDPAGATCVDGKIYYNSTTGQNFERIGGVCTAITSGGTPISGSGSSGRVAFWGSASSLSSDTDLTFATDTLTFTKGIASTNLIGPLHIGGTAVGSSLSLQSTSGVGTTDFINFKVGNAGGTEAMRIIDSGNVGIGTVSPGVQLEVSGGATESNLSVINTSNATNAASVIRVTSDSNSGEGGARIFSPGSGWTYNSYPVGGLGLYHGGNFPIFFATSDAERMRIFGSGGVSIGNTTDPGAGNLSVTGSTKSVSFATATNCSDSAGAAACGSAPAGSFVIDASSTATVVSTTAVTANSQIFLQEDSSLGTRLSVTCNTQSSLVLGALRVTSRTAGTSFTATLEAAPTSNPMCVSYWIVN